MALSDDDKTRVLRMLDELDEQKVKITTSTKASFVAWLATSLPDILAKIRDIIDRVWNWISQLF